MVCAAAAAVAAAFQYLRVAVCTCVLRVSPFVYFFPEGFLEGPITAWLFTTSFFFFFSLRFAGSFRESSSSTDPERWALFATSGCCGLCTAVVFTLPSADPARI